jgi:hypothetical protein
VGGDGGGPGGEGGEGGGLSAGAQRYGNEVCCNVVLT